MPYRTTSTGPLFDGWLSAVTEAFGPGGIPTAFTPVLSTTWTVINPIAGTSAPQAITSNVDSINITWDVDPGRYEVRATTSATIGGTPAPGCANAQQIKEVFVLPRPNLVGRGVSDNGHQMILGCTATVHTVRFDTRGWGNVQVTYNLSRTPLGGSAAVTQNLREGLGNALEADDTRIAANGGNSITTAMQRYTGSTHVTIPIEIDGLEPGYIYTVTLTGISDQISRKSRVGNANDGIVALTSGERTISFAVIPTPTNTHIEHVTNQGW
jgi:hypothetical protein